MDGLDEYYENDDTVFLVEFKGVDVGRSED